MTAFIFEVGMPGFSKGKKFKKLGMLATTVTQLAIEKGLLFLFVPPFGKIKPNQVEKIL
ncbi:MAG TPA: hypothetical protein VMW89_18600 [Desulfatiglandales bacterium]|nr:hypothetical protein [Desulfatiglandales bacterium]